MAATLDLITIGRSSVDLYGEQVGGRLEDMGSFAKYIGGSPTNTAVGAARLGLKRRPDHPRRRRSFRPLHPRGAGARGRRRGGGRDRFRAADGARHPRHPRPRALPAALLSPGLRRHGARREADIDAAFIARPGAVLISGTHLSTPGAFAASLRAAELARAAGGKVVFDIDYRPVLWGLTAPDAGENRFVADAGVTARLREIARLCDLIVGTEEEFQILGGETDTVARCAQCARRPTALLVCKRGPQGCVAFAGAVGTRLDSGVRAPGVDVEVFNVLGAGDAFMGGFLRGWLRGRAAGDLLRLRQRLRGDRRLAPRLRSGHAHLAGAVDLSARLGRGGCARTRSWSTSTGPRRGGRDYR